MARETSFLKTYFVSMSLESATQGFEQAFLCHPYKVPLLPDGGKKGFLFSETHLIMSAHKTASTESLSAVTLSILLRKL